LSDALIHAGNALIRFYGYRPADKFTHATITEYDALFSESHKEVQNSIARADELIKEIEEHIKIKPSQKRLF